MIRQRLRWFFLILVLLTGLVVILSSLLQLAATRPSGERLIKNLIESQAEKSLNRKVRIGSLHTNIFTSINLKNVTIYQENNGEVIPFLDIERAEARYYLYELFRRRFTVHSLIIDGMTVNVARDSSGITNIPFLKPAGSPSQKGRPGLILFSFSHISLNNSSARYQDRKISLDADIWNAGARISVRNAGGYSLDFDADSLRVIYRKEPLIFSSLAFLGEWHEGKLFLGSASMQIPGMKLEGRNIIFAGPDSTLSGEIQLHGNPRDMAVFIRKLYAPALPSLTGTIDLAVSMQGTPHVPRFDVRLSFPTLTVGVSALRNGFIKGNLTASTAIVDSLKIEAFGGNFQGHGKVKVKALEAENIFLSFRGVDISRIGHLFKKEFPCTGTIEGRLQGGGSLHDPGMLNASASLRLYQAGYLSRPLPDVSADLAFSDGTLSASLHGGGAEITFDTRFSREAIDGEFTVSTDSLETISGIAGIPGLSGKVSARGTVGGTYRSPDIAANIIGRMIRYRNFPVDNLNGRMQYLNKTILLSGVKLNGNLHSLASLAPPLHVDSLQGGIEYHGTIEGLLKNPNAELSIRLTGPSWRGMRFVKGEAEAHLENRILSLTKSWLESDSLRFDLSGMFKLDDRQGSAALSLEEKKPGAKKPTLPSQIEVQAPGAPLGSVALDFNVKDVKNPAVTANGKEISLDGLALLFPTLRAFGGTLTFSGSFSGGGMKPNAMLDFHINRPRFRETVLDSARAEIALKDSIMTITALEMYREKYYSKLDGTIMLAKTPQFYAFTKRSVLALTLAGENLDLRFIKPYIPGKVELSGMMSYHLNMKGTLEDPHPGGTITLKDVLFDAGFGVPPVKNMDADIILNNTVANVTTRNAEFLGKSIDLTSTLNYAPGRYGGDGKLALEGREILTVQGTFAPEGMRITSQMNGADLSLVGLVVPMMKGITGTVNSNVVISGARKNLTFEGSLDARDITMNPPWVDMPIKNGIVRMSFSPSQVAVDSVFVHSGNGTILITGTIDDILQKKWSGQLSGSVNNIRIRQKNMFDAVVKSAQLEYSPTGGASLLKGNVDFGSTRILYNIDIQKLLSSAGAAGKGKEPPEIVKQTRLQIQISGGDQFWLDDNLAHVHLLPEVNLVGTLAKPALIGRVEASEGYVLYLDRKFTIQKAALEFIDPEELNPTLDIEAQAKVTGNQGNGTASYTITLGVTGEMKKPQIALSSDPPLEKADILSLLNLGVTRQQIGFGAAQSDTTVSLLGILQNRAGNLATLQISEYMGRQLEGMLGLKSLNIEGNLFQTGQQSTGARLTATKKISENVEVSYITSLGRLNDQGIRVVYDLTKSISLQGETVQQGKSSLDVLYKLRFK
ncbi:MAG: translocation/assembly module TamB domain-containing protein [Candidatus Latescibacter sp.]|nr:translocation/assembly module TamB domain-containing protein [Candidatus Latescibacter sp.]